MDLLFVNERITGFELFGFLIFEVVGAQILLNQSLVFGKAL